MLNVFNLSWCMPVSRAENGPSPIDVSIGQNGKSQVIEKVLSILIVVHKISAIGAN